MKALNLKQAGSSLAVAVAAVAGMSVLGIDAAMAGTDTTFDTALTAFTDFLEGSGGKIITVLSLAGGIVALVIAVANGFNGWKYSVMRDGELMHVDEVALNEWSAI